MMTDKDTIRCESIFNDDRTHRFSWKRVWDKDKPLACVITLNPSLSDNIVTDTTTTLVVNNIARLEEFGGVIITNLFSQLTGKLEFRWHSDEELNDPQNDSYILKAAGESKTVILAWGKGAVTNLRIQTRADTVLQRLRPYAEKLFLLTDGERDGLHPLTPILRSQWSLKPYIYPESKEPGTTEEPIDDASTTDSTSDA